MFRPDADILNRRLDRQRLTIFRHAVAAARVCQSRMSLFQMIFTESPGGGRIWHTTCICISKPQTTLRTCTKIKGAHHEITIRSEPTGSRTQPFGLCLVSWSYPAYEPDQPVGVVCAVFILRTPTGTGLSAFIYATGQRNACEPEFIFDAPGVFQRQYAADVAV